MSQTASEAQPAIAKVAPTLGTAGYRVVVPYVRGYGSWWRSTGSPE